MPDLSYEYDVFLSYASEEREWVAEHLYLPLLRCCTKTEMRKPRIFFDVSDEGIQPGEHWQTALARGLANSRKIVLVYSNLYFDKQFCQWEMALAVNIDPTGSKGILRPILKDDDAAVPLTVSAVQYIPVNRPNWFARLCRSLDLVPGREEQAGLEFLDQPTDVTINHTLPALRVRLTTSGAPLSGEEDEITVSCKESTLQGTATVKTSDGVAVFSDLSLADAADGVRLVASAKGRDPTFCQSFKVSDPPRPRPARTPVETEEPPCIASKGDVVFFASGGTLAVISSGHAALYNADCRPLPAEGGEVKLKGRHRLIRRSGPLLVIADWSGGVNVFSETGNHRTWSFADEKAGGFTIPGDIAVTDDQVYVGFWSGAVYRMTLGDKVPEIVIRHDRGIQALAVADDRIYVCGFDGMLCLYHDRRLANSCQLEPCIRLLKRYPDCLVAIGARKMYHVDMPGMRVMTEDVPLARVANVLGDVNRPVVMDASGKGFRVDSDLAVTDRFHAAVGAVAESADDEGRYCVFRNPDGSGTLLTQGRIVFSHLGGALAVAPGGDTFALGEKSGIRLLTEADMETRMTAASASGRTPVASTEP